MAWKATATDAFRTGLTIESAERASHTFGGLSGRGIGARQSPDELALLVAVHVATHVRLAVGVIAATAEFRNAIFDIGRRSNALDAMGSSSADALGVQAVAVDGAALVADLA